MEQILIDKEAFVGLLEERDSQYRENCRLKNQLKEAEKEIAAQKNTISGLEEDKLSLQSQVAYLTRRLWGSSSERHLNKDLLHPRLPFVFEDDELTGEEKQRVEEAVKEIESCRAKTIKVKLKIKPFRKALPENLPRKEEHLYPEMDNREAYDELPPEVTEILEHEPGKCYVRKIIRHKYVRKIKQDDTASPIITASLPAIPLARSYAGATMLSELMIGKYVDHLPFYRQIQMFKRDGLDLPASTINDWFKETIDLIRPMYYRLQDIIFASDYIQADETTIPVIIKEKNKAVKSYIWLFRSVEDSLVFFHYDKGSRARQTIIPILKNYQGALQTDGYEAYSIYENKAGILHLACWAHARRKFVEALTSDKERAEYALSQISLLYTVERKADTDNLTNEERAALRNKLSFPVLVSFKKWLLRESTKVLLPKSPIGKAIRYTLNNYTRLNRYLLDGRYLIDNNLIENSARAIALGRKNFLFCGNHSAAEDAAVIYSLMGCCKATKVNFREWFEFVLNNIHAYDNDYSRDLVELLPNNYCKAGKSEHCA